MILSERRALLFVHLLRNVLPYQTQNKVKFMSQCYDTNHHGLASPDLRYIRQVFTIAAFFE